MAQSSHLKALLRKNWLLWKRNRLGSLLEILIPVAFSILFLVFRHAEPIQDIAQTSYYTDPAYFPARYPYYMKKCGGDKIALSPPSDPIMQSLGAMFRSFSKTVMYFDDNQAIDDYTQQADYATGDRRLCLAVVMQQNNVNNKYQYLLRYNISTAPGSEDIPDPSDGRIDQVDQADLKSLLRYINSGFMTIQNFIDNLILVKETGKNTARINAYVSSVTVPAYKYDDLDDTIGDTAQYFVALPLILPFLRLINGIVKEKEKRIREGMKIMGLHNAAFYFSWFITYFIIMSITSLIVALILRFTCFFNSSLGYIFLWHWQYSICIIAFALFISVFFSRAKLANIAGFLLIFLLQFIEQAVGSVNTSHTAKFWASIAPPASIALGIKNMLSLESSSRGLTAETVDTVYLNYKMVYHYLWMAIDTVAFLILTAYLDQVLPSEFGIRKHPLFCFQRKKHTRAVSAKADSIAGSATTVDSADQQRPDFEEVDLALKSQDQQSESIMVKNLRKVYPNGKLAVDGISYNMYKGQIFVLLGHNGAGKTSTISMLTGLYPPTGGNISVFDMDIKTNLDDIRQVMGICPQHDVLFDDLTVQEHLELFATFKGVQKSDTKAEIQKLIRDLDLYEKRNYFAKNLSGGQKRRLSIAIAFIGGSKFILLDEPSSGMDTSARRRLWDMLKNYKHDRVILLTTHFMDEADYLGDRIGIMGEGKMQCLGSPLFLKNRFGVGYSLTLTKKDASLKGSEDIIKFITEYIPEMSIVSDVSAEISVQLPLETAHKFQQLFDDLDANLEKLNVENYGVSVTTLEQVFLNVAHIIAKNDLKTIKSKKSIENYLQTDPKDELSPTDLQSKKSMSGLVKFATQFRALIMKRLHYLKRDKKGIVLELFLPVVMIIFGLLLSRINVLAVIEPLPLSDSLYGQKFDVRYNYNPAYGNIYGANLQKAMDSDYFNLIGLPQTNIQAFDTQVFESRDTSNPFSKFNMFFINADFINFRFDYLTEVDTRAQEASPFALNKINQAIIRIASGNYDKEIEVVVSPFEHTKGIKAVESSVSGAALGFVFTIGMSFIPASIITFLVKEKELNVKHQQLVSGVAISSYWFSNYFVDLLKYLIPAVLNCLMAIAFNATQLTADGKEPILWILFLLYGTSTISLVYLTSFLFKDFGTAQTTTFFFHFGTGFIGGIAVAILRIISSANSIAVILQWVLRPLPTFALTSGILNLSNMDVYQLIEKDLVDASPWNLNLAGGDVLFLGGTSVIYFILIFIVEGFRNKRSFCPCRKRSRSSKHEALEYSDTDVAEEAKRVENSSSTEFSVKVNKLQKVYQLGGRKTKTAVHHISFGIKNGDCFALLGVNGAGKTTTFKMLSGDVLQTSGTAHINGFEIPEQLGLAQRDIGYCPQNDPLLENLTAQEHLELYAALRGIHPSQRKRIVRQQLLDMNLMQYANVLAGSFSGGTKRKLSVAIAMIGNPAIVFLDEPSTGMDPEARRFMWDVITRISKERQKSTVILTTHSMDEAEALSTKVGIMVEGRLKCLGTVQHIKNRYGGGYEVEIKQNLVSKAQIQEAAKGFGFTMGVELNKNQIENLLKEVGMAHVLNEAKEDDAKNLAIYQEIKRGKTSVDFLIEWILNERNGQKLKEFFEKCFEGTILIEHFSTFYRFRIASNISIGTVFGTIEENKVNLGITQYSVRQSSIEQIFNMFATNAQPETDKKARRPSVITKDLHAKYPPASATGESQAILQPSVMSPLETPTTGLLNLEPTIIEMVSPTIRVQDLEAVTSKSNNNDQ